MSDAKDSIFLLEAYYESVSLLSETDTAEPNLIEDCIAKMKAICE